MWTIKPIPNNLQYTVNFWRTVCCSQFVGKDQPKADERLICQVSSYFACSESTQKKVGNDFFFDH